MTENKNLTIEEAFELAVEYHQKKNIQVARNLYKQILKINPSHANAHNNLGIISKELGEYQKAISYHKKAIEIYPQFVSAHNNLGVVFKVLGEYQKSISCYKKAIHFNPNHTNALSNLGEIFFLLSDYNQAKSYSEKVIKIDHYHANAHNNLGLTFNAMGLYKKAVSCFEIAIKIDSNSQGAHNNLGKTLKGLGKYEKAKNCFEKAIEIDPNYIAAHNNLGTTFKDLEEYQKAISCFEKALKIDPSSLITQKNITDFYISKLDDFEKAISSSYKVLKIQHEKSQFINQKIPLFRLKHDVQQAKYLSSKNYKINGIDKFQNVGDKILSRKENIESENIFGKKILLDKDEIKALLPFYKENLIYKTKIISESCINPNKNWQNIEDEYLNDPKQIIHIDNFLSDEAVKELHEFCLVSKVWNDEFKNKYLGSTSDSGFISPIHLQIAIDLKQKLPKLFGPHRLGKFWGFKYDSALGKGINIHADFAIHNLNFWVTPDEYNNNKNSGGLKIYDFPAPEHWTFREYNTDKDEIYKFLKNNNASFTNIPYKFNRAVLFNSAYFHETDEIDFKDEYVGRRINNTYLFGNRLVQDRKMNEINSIKLVPQNHRK